ncbi:hypothetical protein C8J57DRAFT_1478395 [Mycena rebaudengoi]|nr:hypothetical protein C8J57DRAFT_1478395 [Mycena rebaudengoi]
MTPTVPPIFPPDLEREIFEMTATEHPKTMTSLVLVAHRVLQWIEPLLYRTLVLTHKSRQHRVYALMLAAQRTPAKFTKYTQNLFLWHEQNSPNDKCAMLLMSLCNGISRLSLFDSKPAMLPALDNMRVNRLAVSLASLFGNPSDPCQIGIGRPLFQAVTHLEVWDTSELAVGAPFAQLPALTHLCVTQQRGCVIQQRGDLQLFLSILKKCEKLHVLIDGYWFQVEFKQVLVDDPRLVLMTHFLGEYVAEWEVGIKGGQDFWARAEKFIAKKKRGEIKPVFRCWILEEDLID